MDGSHIFRLFSLLLFGCFAQTHVVAQEEHLPVAFFGKNIQDSLLDFSASAELFMDSTGKLELEKVRTASFSPLSNAPVPRQIVLKNCRHNYWLRFRATGYPWSSEEGGDMFFFFGNQHFVTLFFSGNGRDWQKREGGFAAHRKPGQNEYMPLKATAGDTTIFYARIANRPRPDFALRAQVISQRGIETAEALALSKNRWIIYPSLVATILSVFMSLFTLLQYWQNRERAYLYYALYVLSIAIGLLKINEHLWQMPLLFSYFPSAFVFSEGIGSALPHITYRLFVADITDLKKHLPGIARLFNFTIWFVVGYAVLDILLEIFFFREAYWAYVYPPIHLLLGLVSVYCMIRMFSIHTPIARMIVWGSVVLYLGIGIGLFIAPKTGFNFQGERINYMIAACTIEILIFLMALGKRSKLLAEERNRLEKDLLEAHTHLARDLHDDLGSALSSISLNSQLAAAATPDKMREALNRTGEEAREMTSKVRDLMWSLQADNDSIESIVSRMRQFAAPILEAQNIDYQFEISENTHSVQLGVAERRHFYLFFKEAVNNLAKYAHATTVYIQIRCAADHKFLYLEVSDNGKGFDPDTVQGGHGLANMAARATLLNGQMSVVTAPGEGTKIVLSFPL
ncbi:MAG: ATP-binding protein [Saprospiraceae bacterium]